MHHHTRHFYAIFVFLFCAANNTSAQTTVTSPTVTPTTTTTAPVSSSSRDLFTTPAPLAVRASDAAVTDKQVVRSREVAINFNMLTAYDAAGSPIAKVGQTLTLNLFDDAVLNVVADEVTSTKRGISWVGHIEGVEHGQVVLVVSGGVVSANVSMPSARYHVRFLQSGIFRVQQIDTSLFPSDHPPSYQELETKTLGALLNQQGASVAADDGSFIDVMVVYSPAARAAAGGVAAMASLIDLAVTETNASYANSQIVQRIRLVHSEEVAYVEADHSSPDPFAAAKNCIVSTTDGCLDNIHALRNTYAADIVSLWIEDLTYCGLAAAILSTADTAFNVVGRSCATGYFSFGHEMGHNMGARHDTYVDSTATPYTYGHGLTNPTATSPWRTIMGYNNACAAVGKNCARIQYWSNPGVTYGGAPMGTVGAEDNHRVLNSTAYTVANFRTAVTQSVTAPATPTIGSAIAGNSSIQVAFTPGSIGSGALVSYWAGCSNDGWAIQVNKLGPSSPINVTGLVNGSSYVCAVIAQSDAAAPNNFSTWSANSNAVTPNVAVTPVDLTVTTVLAPATGLAGGSIYVTATVLNQGGTTAAANLLEFYLSTNSTISTADIDTNWGCTIGPINPGQYWVCQGDIIIPSGVVNGTYYFGAIADRNALITESNKNNNTLAAATTLLIKNPSSPICTLSARPAHISPGRPTTLTPTCAPAATSYAWTGGTCQGTTASTCTVTPAATTAYGFTGTNSYGSSTASATVTVKAVDLTPILMLLLD